MRGGGGGAVVSATCCLKTHSHSSQLPPAPTHHCVLCACDHDGEERLVNVEPNSKAVNVGAWRAAQQVGRAREQRVSQRVGSVASQGRPSSPQLLLLAATQRLVPPANPTHTHLAAQTRRQRG